MLDAAICHRAWCTMADIHTHMVYRDDHLAADPYLHVCELVFIRLCVTLSTLNIRDSSDATWRPAITVPKRTK